MKKPVRKKAGDRLVDVELNKKVRARDNYTCQMCRKRRTPRYLEIHHIKRWSDSIGLRFVEDNLITLCKKCHKSIRGKEVFYELYFLGIIHGKKKYR